MSPTTYSSAAPMAANRPSVDEAVPVGGQHRWQRRRQVNREAPVVARFVDAIQVARAVVVVAVFANLAQPTRGIPAERRLFVSACAGDDVSGGVVCVVLDVAAVPFDLD